MRTGVTPPGRPQPADPTWCPTARRKPCPLPVVPRSGSSSPPSSRPALSALTVAPAHAAAYRYWGFYQLTDGAWTFAQKGPATRPSPTDGSVDGWRYAVADEASTRYPRAVLTFDADLRHDPGRRRARSASASSSTSAVPARRRRRRDPARAQGPVRGRRRRRHERRRARRRRRRPHREGPRLRCRRLPDERLRRRRQGGQRRGQGRRPAGDHRGPGRDPVRQRVDPGVHRGRHRRRQRRPRPHPGRGRASRHTSSQASLLLALIGYLLVRSRSRARQDG